MTGAQATIDGRGVEIAGGETILAAARRAGIEIPTLCHVEGLPPEGGCRVCLVEVAGRAGYHAACHTPAAPGMTVRTESPELARLRRDVLSLIVSRHETGTFAPDPAGRDFARLLARCGPGDAALAGAGGGDGAATAVDDSHPYMRFDRELCIACRRCLRVCEEVQGQFVYGIEGRGGAARLVFGPTERFADGPCTACGACVDACPTGAVTDRDRRGGGAPQAVTQSVCGYCGVGCRIAVETAGDRVLRIAGVPDAAVNRGHLCAKGRFAHAYHRAPDRLTQPLRRERGRFVPIPWPEAISWLAAKLAAIRAAHGPDALGVMTSSRSTNEAAYLLQKLFRAIVGTNNVDCCARVCHSSTALALQLTTGTGAASASFDDVEKARCIVVAGANPTEAHPVVGARIKQAALRGATLIVVDPRRIELADYADVHLRLRPGTNVALFNALARAIIERGAVDRAYVAERTEGFAALAASVSGATAVAAAEITGVAPEMIERAATIIGSAGPVLFVSGLGLSETTQGTASVIALSNLAMLTGSIGREGAGMLPLRGQNNVQGNADVGGMPDRVTGYQPLDDPETRARLQRLWGAVPPPKPGFTVHEMLEAAAARRIRALWIQGEDVAQSDPSQTRVIEALEALDLLVVQEIFMSETARFAHLVLPAASALEQDGTFTNGERRIQRVRPAVASPGAARPDWEVVRDVANAMGATWRYAAAADVMDEIALVAPRIFGGVRFDRLDPDGLQWPCPAPDHPGTRTVHARGFLRGKGRLVAVDYAPGPEHAVAGYPYVLITGRVLHHYNVGTMTRRTPSRLLAPEDVLEIHPDDAAREAIADGDRVAVESRWGRTAVHARHAQRVLPGTLFLSFHYPQTHANALVGPHHDPQSKCPDYKVTAVRIRAAAEPPAPG